MERRLSFPDCPEENLASTTQSDMHDFSISSLISNVSKLLEGNNSSFLVHVDSRRRSRTPTSFNSTSKSKTSKSSSPDGLDVSDHNAPPTTDSDILVLSTPLHRKLGKQSEQANDSLTDDSQKKLEDSRVNFSLADLIEKAEKNVKAHRSKQPPFPVHLDNGDIGLCVPSSSSMKQIPDSDLNTYYTPAEDDESDVFLLSDIIKGIKNPLPIRRFPAPMLPAIFEQSCEDFSIHSRSRTSSVASSVCRGTNNKSSLPIQTPEMPIPTKQIEYPFVSSPITEWINGPAIDSPDVEYQRSDDTDSWDAFDKVMDKSLPPKAWELHEFEELVTKNKSVHLEKDVELSFEFVGSEDAKLLMDKDEEDRAQFLKSADASFATGGDSVVGTGVDFMSMTNYFQLRSSFPIDNQANESSMFHDDYTARQEDIQHSILLDNTSLMNKDVSLTPNSNTILEQTGPTSSSPIETQTPSILGDLLDSKTKNLARFLMGSESNGMEKNSIMEHVLEMCKRRSSIIANTNDRTPIPKVIIEQDVTKNPELHNEVLKQPAVSKTKIPISIQNHIDQSTKDPVFLKPKVPERPISGKRITSEKASTLENRSSSRPRSNPSTTPKSRVTFQQPLEANSARKPGNNTDEIETSIMLSEHGKAAFFDDLDTHGNNGFDEFKRYLMSGTMAEKDLLKVDKSLKENSQPVTSAFVQFPNLSSDATPTSENPSRKSFEMLRRTATSPPEKLVSNPSAAINEKYQSIQAIFSNKMGEANPNHSTPITAEPLSVQLAKSMNSDNSSLKLQQATTTTANSDSNSRHSTRINKMITDATPSHPAIRTSSTPNEFDYRTFKTPANPKRSSPTEFDCRAPKRTNSTDFEHRALRTLADPNGRMKQGPSDQHNQVTDSLRSVEVARSHPDKQTSRPRSRNSQNNPPLKTKYSSSEKRERVSTSNFQPLAPESIQLSSAGGSQTHSGISSYGHQHLPMGYPPPAYGFPVSIHIHLPTMPYQQQPYPHPYEQSTGYHVGSHSQQAPASNSCQCHFPTEGSNSKGKKGEHN